MPEQLVATGHHRALSVPKKDSSARMGKEGRVRRSKIVINSGFLGSFAKKDKKPSLFLRKLEK